MLATCLRNKAETTFACRNLNRFLDIKLVETEGEPAEWNGWGFGYLETAEEREERKAQKRRRHEKMHKEDVDTDDDLSDEDYYTKDGSKADQEDVQPPWVPEKDYLEIICNRSAFKQPHSLCTRKRNKEIEMGTLQTHYNVSSVVCGSFQILSVLARFWWA